MRQVPKFAKWKDCDVFARRSYRFFANEAYCQSARWSSIDAISRWEGKDKGDFWGGGRGRRECCEEVQDGIFRGRAGDFLAGSAGKQLVCIL